MSDAGLCFMRARFYDPKFGRFLSEDPIYVAGDNPYTYAMANPLRYADPMGWSATSGEVSDEDAWAGLWFLVNVLGPIYKGRSYEINLGRGKEVNEKTHEERQRTCTAGFFKC